MAKQPAPITELDIKTGRPKVKASSLPDAPSPQAATPAPAPVPLTQPRPTSGAKTAIVLEMILLFGATVVTKKAAGVSWTDLFLKGTLTKSATAVVILLAILLTMEELGAGGVAVAFGGLIVFGYFLAAGGVLGQNVLAVEQSFFGTVPQPAAPTGAATK